MGKGAVNISHWEVWTHFVRLIDADGDQVESKLNTLITQYSEVFENGLWTFNGPKAKIHAMKEKIEEKLKRWQEEGTTEPVQFSKWAGPIVPILKRDNSIHICGDNRINQV